MSAPRLNWIPDRPVDAACALCGNTDRNVAFLEAEHSEIPGLMCVAARCGACESVWFPDFDQFATNYPEDLGFLEEPDFHLLVRHYIELTNGLDWKIQLLERLPFERFGSVLEIGCNVGAALDYCRRVWDVDVIGLEPSIYGRAGKQALELPILHTYMAEAAELAGRSFDLVYATEVIEHVPDPVQFLREIRSFVAPGGCALLTTPAASKVAPEAPVEALYPSLSPGAHRFLFSEQRLRNIAKQAGFSWAHVESPGFTTNAVLADEPLDVGEPVEFHPRLQVYYAARAANPSGSERARLVDQMLAITTSMNVGMSIAPDTIAAVDLALGRLFGIDLSDLSKLPQLVQRLCMTETIFDVGDTMPFCLPAYVFWRGHLEGLTDNERIECWEAAGALAAHGMATNPVNMFVNINVLRMAHDMLTDAPPGRLRNRLLHEIAANPGLAPDEFTFVTAPPEPPAAPPVALTRGVAVYRNARRQFLAALPAGIRSGLARFRDRVTRTATPP
ncbi:MAG TPA: class I SAM-dependent methyltransferase [Ilumatobacter sp.]|nr:class I SAM-dependent methyltransferase [Ilumatobacter sp.]